MRTALLAGTLLCLVHFSYGQDSLSRVPRQALKFSPLNLVGTFPTLDFSFEQRIYRQVTAQVGYGYVLNYSSFDDDNEITDRRGHKIRAEVRYYITQRTRVLPYTSAEYVRNYIRYDHMIESRGCFDPICSFTYQKRSDYPVKLNEEGVNIKFGFVTYIKHRVMIDINAGLRYRHLNYNESDLPLPSDRFDEDEFDGFFPEPYTEEDRELLRLVIGVRFGYRFR